MSDAIQTPVGQALRAAREAQGMSVEDAANRLRLMLRQIEAMEADDFASLGQPVFARGFVRNYARLLGLDPEPLLAGMAGAPTDAAPVAHAAPPPPGHWLTSPWLIVLLLGALLAVAVPVALYWWLNSDVEENVLPVSANAEMHAAVPPAPAVAPVATPPAAAPSSGQSAPVVAEAAVAPVPPAEAVASPAPAPAAASSALHLDFGADSWVEIKDASGRTLMRQLNPSGSSIEVKGQPPFDVVIGNAGQVRLTYNSRPIDLTPFIDVTVARFTLEE